MAINPGCYPGLGASALSGRAGNLHQFKNFTRRLPLQHFQLEVLSGNDTLASENLLHGLSRQFGMIILLAEMAEPYVAEARSGEIGKRMGTLIITEMTVRTQDSLLQILRIFSRLKHLHAIVRFQHQIVRLADELLNLLRDMSHIRNQTECDALVLHEIAHIIRTVVRHPKRSNPELAHLERHTFLYDVRMIGHDFLSDGVAKSASAWAHSSLLR